MKKINDNVIIASGKEMYEAEYMPESMDTKDYLWLKYKWNPAKENDLSYAPFCDVSIVAEKQHTHLIENRYYCSFPKNENDHFMFIGLLSKYVDVKELASQFL